MCFYVTKLCTVRLFEAEQFSVNRKVIKCLYISHLFLLLCSQNCRKNVDEVILSLVENFHFLSTENKAKDKKTKNSFHPKL